MTSTARPLLDATNLDPTNLDPTNLDAASSGPVSGDGTRPGKAGLGDLHDARIKTSSTAAGTPPGFHLAYLAGRLTELSGPSSMSLAISLVQHAQQQLEPVAWITSTRSLFFPPDAVECGVELETLPIIQLTTVADAARAADHLLRSGAFGLVVLDLGKTPRVPPALSTRLQGLALRHEAAVLFLTKKPPSATSISPLVTIRAQAWRKSLGGNRFACGLEIQKDKRHGPGWVHEERRRGPAGVC